MSLSRRLTEWESSCLSLGAGVVSRPLILVGYSRDMRFWRGLLCCGKGGSRLPFLPPKRRWACPATAKLEKLRNRTHLKSPWNFNLTALGQALVDFEDSFLSINSWTFRCNRSQQKPTYILHRNLSKQFGQDGKKWFLPNFYCKHRIFCGVLAMGDITTTVNHAVIDAWWQHTTFGAILRDNNALWG